MPQPTDHYCRVLFVLCVVIVLAAELVIYVQDDPRHQTLTDYRGALCGTSEAPIQFADFLSARHVVQSREWSNNTFLLLDLSSMGNPSNPVCIAECPAEWKNVSVGTYGWEAVNGLPINPREEAMLTGYALELPGVCLFLPFDEARALLNRTSFNSTDGVEKLRTFAKEKLEDPEAIMKYGMQAMISLSACVLIVPGMLLLAGVISAVLPFAMVPVALAVIAVPFFLPASHSLLTKEEEETYPYQVLMALVLAVLWMLLFYFSVGFKRMWTVGVMLRKNLSHTMFFVCFGCACSALYYAGHLEAEKHLAIGTRHVVLSILYHIEQCVLGASCSNFVILLVMYQLQPTKSIPQLFRQMWRAMGSLFAVSILKECATILLSPYLWEHLPVELLYVFMISFLKLALVLVVSRNIDLLDSIFEIVQNQKARAVTFVVLHLSMLCALVIAMTFVSIGFGLSVVLVDWTLSLPLVLSWCLAAVIWGHVISSTHVKFFADKLKQD